MNSLLVLVALSQSPAIVATPNEALIDAPVKITVNRLPPARQIVLRSIVRLDSAHAVVAWGTYVPDRTGTIQLDRDASTAGTYTGIDPMGLLWSGRVLPVDSISFTSVPGSAFAPPKPYQVLITASMNDSVVASTTITRMFGRADVTEEEIRNGDVVGKLFIPRHVRRPGAVIVLSGSEGGYESSSYKARMLAAHGFAAFAQAYFRAPGLSDELASIPLERVQRGIAWLRARANVSADRIAIIAASRGTELALLSAGVNSNVRAVVVYATSVTTGSGLTRGGEPHPEAAWTLNGKPLPAMQHQPTREALAQFSRPEPVKLRLLFEPSLRNHEAVERAAIPVSSIKADVLVVSGIDDQMGPSDVAGDMLLERLVRSGHRARRVHLKYPEAGHVISIPYTPASLRLRPWRFSVGGTVAGYARADADSWSKLLEFLTTSLR